MPSTNARKEREKLAKTLKTKRFLCLCAILANDAKFSILLSECNDFVILNAYVFEKAQMTDFKEYVMINNAFAITKSIIVTYPSNDLPISVLQLQQAFRSHVSKRNHASTHRRKRQTAARIGFSVHADTIADFLPTVYLTKLSSPYPHPKAYVLERSSPIPEPPKENDAHCGKCQTLLPLDESLLQYTLPPTQSAIFRDSLTNEIIAVVIRNFARDSFHLIKPWAVNLIEDTISRRILCQRNGPGQMARVGVTDGPRNAKVFGWNRSLKKKFREDCREDYADHERDISAGFGLFYALLLAQAPAEITNKLESAMKTAKLPQLDFDKKQQFLLPFCTEHPMTFTGYPLSPPEGYVARNFSKQIHNDRYLKNCPYGAYWNIE